MERPNKLTGNGLIEYPEPEFFSAKLPSLLINKVADPTPCLAPIGKKIHTGKLTTHKGILR